jgi:hypothetical protein
MREILGGLRKIKIFNFNSCDCDCDIIQGGDGKYVKFDDIKELLQGAVDILNVHGVIHKDSAFYEYANEIIIRKGEES